jgi:uncharacterized membrane protein YccC
MDACARLHALHQLLKRLRASHAASILAAIAPCFDEPRVVFEVQPGECVEASRVAAGLHRFRANLPRRLRERRRPLKAASAESLADFDTAAELLYRFVGEWISYSENYASLWRTTENSQKSVRRSQSPHKNHRIGKPVSQTNHFVVLFTFLRSAVVIGIAGSFWIATDWPSGGLAVIGATLVCGLTSTAPSASRMVVQMALGAVFATLTGYVFIYYVYSNIDGFPLLGTVVAPVLALGAFIATRRGRVWHRLFGVLLSACRAGLRRQLRPRSADQQRRRVDGIDAARRPRFRGGISCRYALARRTDHGRLASASGTGMQGPSARS